MMPTVTLPGTSRTTSAIGFGGNALLGPKSRREGLALLEAAHDAGVRHFDVARAYSSGDAEGLLGEFLADGCKRDGVTVTTKFGLQPAGGGVSRMPWVKNLARRIMRLSPGLRKVIGARAGQMVRKGAFSPDEARASLETSLRELRTDRVEILLLHEGSATDCTPELRAFLDSEVQRGRVGAYGVGSGFVRAREIPRDRPEFARILQFESSATHRNREALNPQPGTFTITHGAIGGSFTGLRTFLAEYPEAARRWSAALGVDVAAAATLAPLMLASAVRANPGGIVLFSSTRPEAIRDNIRAIVERRFVDEQVDRFRELASEVVGGVAQR